MVSDNEQGYKPPPEFQVEGKEPLIDPSSIDSKELWLIQWPHNKEVSFSLRTPQVFQKFCFYQDRSEKWNKKIV